MPDIKVVIGANYGDEGKGLVSGCLAREAAQENKSILTVFFNGTVQRCHTYQGEKLHCIGAGDLHGGDTYYHPMFVVDPIALWLTNTMVYIDPLCRLILPCDVVKNRETETKRGAARHGSCGFGLFEAVKRCANPRYSIVYGDLQYPALVYEKITAIQNEYNSDLENDELYNLTNWFKATQYLLKYCPSRILRDIYYKYDTIIYEGGQGLLLSQKNVGDFPHLTPSCTGATNIAKEISGLNCETDIYYVSRSYMTRHGNGPMEYECAKDDINSTIVDKTNQANEWQGSLRFGFLNQEKLLERVKNDFATYHEGVRAHMVYTQLNYTDNKLCVGENKLEEIEKPNFISSVYGSNKEDEMFKAL